MTPQEVLLAAADRIERRGLWQDGVPESSTNGECPLIAIGKASRCDGDLAYAADALLMAHLGFTGKTNKIAKWSDASTKEVVVRTMRHVAGEAS